ncbi:GH116 family glycosyl-hydrolase [Paenibacillus silvisoli]|uniref:GH116 family glycosyl-hydrolase n=1 Tax=Paenibacillus silvisoli TaxID=3110539 RepID=UPI0028063871|nr:GH116 family glycosyl-hydrolase [Paenibacillus silvisoli]
MSNIYATNNLMDFGPQRSYGPQAALAGFLVGGIGTGTFTVGQRGQLKDWEIFNGPGKGNYLPNTFFAIRVQEEGVPASAAVSKVLESQLLPPYDGSHGFVDYKVGGIPRFQRSELKGEYPFVQVRLFDDELPIEATMESFNPLIPLHADDSGIPAGMIRYKVKNVSDRALDVSIAGSLANFASLKGYDRHTWDYYQAADRPHNEYRDGEKVRGLFYRPETLQEDDFYYGTMALMTDETDVTYKRAWLNGGWWDGLQDFWDDFRDDGRLEPESAYTQKEVDTSEPGNIGSLAVHKTIPAGEERTFQFLIGWHFPHRVKSWTKRMYDTAVRGKCTPDYGCCPPEGQPYPSIKNYYATKFSDAWAAGEYMLTQLERLESQSRLYHQSFFSSTLPSYVLDAVSANITVLRSNTCFRLEDGTLMAFEGCFDDDGCCEGNCSHVWNYAQTVAYLFPELERSMRRLEFTLESEEDGKMNFRSYKVWNMGAHGHVPAADGQLGTIVRFYREWKFSGDHDFLRELWPSVKRALDYSIRTWDQDGDGIADSDQFVTYDILFKGHNSLVSSLFYAALKAGAEMARAMGDGQSAEGYELYFQRGSAAMDEMLWNGSYYIQQMDDVDEYRYQYGIGCLSDQLFGQTLAHLCGLGYVLPEAHVKQAVRAIFTHNFMPSFKNHHNTQRTYVLNEESGLLMCSWPDGGRTRFPFPYSDEVWPGVEYQVATHLIYEGYVDEGLTLVKAVRDRHDGVRRNPWNEVECGHHYARSMASYGVFAALAGFSCDMVKGTVSFKPALELDRFECFFSTGKAWGTYTREKGTDGGFTERIDILYGDASSVTLVPQETKVTSL